MGMVRGRMTGKGKSVRSCDKWGLSNEDEGLWNVFEV